MNIAYFGSPQISADLLASLLNIQEIKIELIVTQPDKPAGKQLAITPTPVKALGLSHTINIFDQPLNQGNNQEILINILAEKKINLGILFAYGALIRQPVLDYFKHGIWNIHPSLLPLYRGPSPTTYPLLLGDPQTAVTLMLLEKKLDAGPIIKQHIFTLNKEIRRDDLEKKIIPTATTLIKDSITQIINNEPVSHTVQDESKATFTRLLTKEDGYISNELLTKAMNSDVLAKNEIPTILREYNDKYLNQEQFRAADMVYNMYRGLYPWPGIWTTIKINDSEKRLKILDVEIIENKLIIHTVQIEGKNKIDFPTFKKAYSCF